MKEAHAKTDYEIRKITKFIREYVRDSRAKGVVLGISGGVDSAVVAALSAKAIGQKHVLCLLMFEESFGNNLDYEDAMALIKKFSLRSLEIKITAAIESIKNALIVAGIKPSRITVANIKARIRMTINYALANESNLLVIGTGDRSEELIGYFTKYGDGGVDLLPIAHLYKRDVKELAKRLGVPRRIIEKPSSPNLWKGHKASDELPVDYPILDKVLENLFDKKLPLAQASRLSGVSLRVAQDAMKRHMSSKHKREYPPMLTD